jgi:D-glycero-D-manno-heptose 1,7-bisphosphate phosphatase
LRKEPSTRAPGRPAVILDRDGTLVVEREWILAPEALEFERNAARGLALLGASSFAVCVATNQSAVARGLLRVEELEAIHERLRGMCAAAGAPLVDVLYCPHHPHEGRGPYRRACACRKPGHGLHATAARLHGLDLAASWAIGDAARDAAAARAAGCRAVHVLTGKGRTEEAAARAAHPGILVAPDLATAAEAILAATARA